MSAKKDANIVSSNISSTSQQGSIDINAQNVNIADAQENTKIQNEEYSRSSTEINHKKDRTLSKKARYNERNKLSSDCKYAKNNK